MVNAKKQTISQGCKACGFHGGIEFNHKLNTFILKNPPNAPAGQVLCNVTENVSFIGYIIYIFVTIQFFNQASGSEGKRSKRSKKGSVTSNGDANNGSGNHAPLASEVTLSGEKEFTPDTAPKITREVIIFILLHQSLSIFRQLIFF